MFTNGTFHPRQQLPMRVVQNVPGSVELVIAQCQLSKNARHQLYVESILKNEGNFSKT